MTMPSNCWVPTSYYALSHSLTEPQLWLLWDYLGSSVNGLETRSWQPVLSGRMISWLFFPTTLGFIQRSAGVAGCQKPAHFLNNRLPLMGGNWCNKVSHCTPNDLTEATAQPKGSSQDRLLNSRKSSYTLPAKLPSFLVVLPLLQSKEGMREKMSESLRLLLKALGGYTWPHVKRPRFKCLNWMDVSGKSGT